MSHAVTLNFEEYGAPHLPALIILHGFFAAARNWRQVAKQLAAQHHVYVLDMRNHGASPHAEIMDYPAMAADVIFFLKTQQLAKANILGHSMGGKVAMWLALSAPECIHKLIVADISPVSYRHSFEPLIQALQALPLEHLSTRKQADAGLSNAIPDVSFRQFLLQNLVLKEGAYGWRIDLDIFANTADNIIAFPATDALAVYADKALFLAGETSSYVQEESVYTLFPQADIKRIAGAGHWLQAEQPKLFCLAVDAFLCADA